MKITLFNDTSEDWPLHPGSEEGINGEDCIDAQTAVVFDVPSDHDVFIKVWDSCAMVRTSGAVLTNAEARQVAFANSERIERRFVEAREADARMSCDPGAEPCHEGCDLCAILEDLT